MDTIYALATARGKAGVAMVRVSGPDARKRLAPLIGVFPEPRKAALRPLRHGGEVLDEALVLWFEAGRSFTGEEVVELHLHGSPAVVQAVLAVLAGLPGLRMAEAGEFTRRALQNGRLDLAQVEGLSDLIAAETEAQRRQAMRLFSGELGQRAEQWRAKLLRAAALLEAVLDFADEDVPIDVQPEVLALVCSVIESLEKERAGFSAAERIRDGFEVAIVGAPNAGKSTLLNCLAGREAALTSEHAGTTRDIIEVRMDLAGLPVTILDTAGLRSAMDPVEAMGIARARQRAQRADLRVFLVAPGEPPVDLECQEGDLVVMAKADLVPDPPALAVSGKTGAGVDRLIAGIAAVLSGRAASAATITRLRHRAAVEAAIDALRQALDDMEQTGSEDVAADSLRRAIDDMDALVGRVGVEDVLGEIFAAFCIGK
jgi:tRNA modification GTPase